MSVTFVDNPITSTVSSDRYDFIVVAGDKIHPERAPVNVTATISYIQAVKDGVVTTFGAMYQVIFEANDELVFQGNIRHIFLFLRR